MATISPRLRSPFDRSQEFTAVKSFKLNGKQVLPGSPFDKSAVSTRRLRQLYEQRYLTMALGSSEIAIPQYDASLIFNEMTDDQLKEFFKERGHTPRPGLSHEALVEKAVALAAIPIQADDAAANDKPDSEPATRGKQRAARQ